MTRRLLIALLIVGTALVVGAPSVWLATRPAASAGDVAAIEAGLGVAPSGGLAGAGPAPVSESDSPRMGWSSGAGQAPVAPDRSSGGGVDPTISPETAGPEVLGQAERPSRLDGAAMSGASGGGVTGDSGERVAPARLRVPALEIAASVHSAGVDAATGQMEVPDDAAAVGWYRFGPTPGEPGSAVLAAHVDTARQGPGVFFELGELRPGDEVFVDYDDGSTGRFFVEARITYDKDSLPLNRVFARQGTPVLTLITCGGGFSRSSRSYDSNVVVYAVPADEAGRRTAAI